MHKNAVLSFWQWKMQLDIGRVDLLPRERARELYRIKKDQVARAILRRMGPKQLLLKDKITFVLGSTCLWCVSEPVWRQAQ